MTRLNEMHSRQLEIEALAESANQTDDRTALIGKLRQSQQLCNVQIGELIAHSLDLGEKYAHSLTRREESLELNRELLERLAEESNHNDNLFDNICIMMLNEPRETIDLMLGQADRNAKIEDATGESWKWSYKFKFIARLRVAIKLLI